MAYLKIYSPTGTLSMIDDSELTRYEGMGYTRYDPVAEGIIKPAQTQTTPAPATTQPPAPTFQAAATQTPQQNFGFYTNSFGTQVPIVSAQDLANVQAAGFQVNSGAAPAPQQSQVPAGQTSVSNPNAAANAPWGGTPAPQPQAQNQSQAEQPAPTSQTGATQPTTQGTTPQVPSTGGLTPQQTQELNIAAQRVAQGTGSITDQQNLDYAQQKYGFAPTVTATDTELGGGNDSTQPNEPVGPDTNGDGEVDFGEQVDEILSKYGITSSDPTVDPLTYYTDTYKKLYDTMGLGSIKSQYETTLKESQDIVDELNGKIADINEDPWLTQGVKENRIKAVKDRYETKLNTLSNYAKLYQSQFESGQQEAQFVTNQVNTIAYHNQALRQDLVFKALDIAQKQSEAEMQMKEDILNATKFTQIGTDDFGEPVYGFVNERTKEIYNSSGTPSSTEESPSGSYTEGSVSYRTNNPGNIKFGDFAVSMGGTDSGIAATDGGTFAKFNSLQDGINAHLALLRAPSYSNLSVEQAMRRWSNNGYGAEIAKALGIKPDQKMSSLNDIQIRSLQRVMQVREGFVPPPVGSRGLTSDNPVVQSIVNDPSLWADLSSAEKEKYRPTLSKLGFKFPGDTSTKKTEGQYTTALYADRMMESNKIITQLGYKFVGTGSYLGAKLPNIWKSSERQQYEQAQRNFVNAVLRKESGAVISPEEFENAQQQYFPQPGDRWAVINQKAQNRTTAIAGMVRASNSIVSNVTTPDGASWTQNPDGTYTRTQ